MELKVGDRAPNFSLLDGEGNTITLADLLGKRIILYFYPRDNTSGCTKEACALRDVYPQLQQQEVLVLGVSKDDAKSHQKFIEKFQLPFPLLCDLDASVATAYESYGLKKMMGKEYMGIMRHTFVIGKEGTIEQIYTKIKPETHGAEILADLAVMET